MGNGTTSFINLSGFNSIIPNATNKIRVTKSGNSVKLFVNGAQVASQAIIFPAGTADAAASMTLVRNASASVNVYLKDVMIFNTPIQKTNATQLTLILCCYESNN